MPGMARSGQHATALDPPFLLQWMPTPIPDSAILVDEVHLTLLARHTSTAWRRNTFGKLEALAGRSVTAPWPSAPQLLMPSPQRPRRQPGSAVGVETVLDAKWLREARVQVPVLD